MGTSEESKSADEESRNRRQNMKASITKLLLTALLVLGLLLPAVPIVAEGQEGASEALEVTTHPITNTTAASTTLHGCPDSRGGYPPAVPAREPSRVHLIDDTATSLTSIDALTIERHYILESASRFRRVSLAAWVGDSDGIAVGDELTLDLFADASYVATIDRVSVDIQDTISVRGRLDECPASYILMSTNDGRTLASVRVPYENLHYLVFYEPQTGDHYLAEIDPTKADEVQPAPPLVPPPPAPEEEMEIAVLQERIAADLGPEDPATIDVMVVYTPGVAALADQYGVCIESSIAQVMQKAQLVLDNSDTGVTLRLVHSAEVDYDEGQDSSETHLVRLTNTNDGYMDEVHEWRDEYQADLVALFTGELDVGGRAWALDSVAGRPGFGFSVVGAGAAAMGYTFIHELGHNMGCHHHKDQNYSRGPTRWSDWPANTWSAGWRWTGEDDRHYCSVMTYGSGEYFDDGVDHTQVPYFSNPSISYQGQPTGHETRADNARTIREMKHVIAAYRPVKEPQTAPGLLWPEDGAFISGDTVTFSWTAIADARTYWLGVYDGPPGEETEFYWNEVGSRTSHTVSGFHDDGRIYYWAVCAANAGGLGPWAPFRHFFNRAAVAPALTTQATGNITTDSATLSMDYTVGDYSPVVVRFRWRESGTDPWGETARTRQESDGMHVEVLSELDPDTVYEFKTQLTYDMPPRVIEGGISTFTTRAKGGCFIATATYGTPMAEEVQILREFRDGYLLTNPVGQAFVAIYYRTSPPIAEFLDQHPALKPIARVGLMPVVAISSAVLNTTPAAKAGIVSLLVLVSVTLAGVGWI